MVMLTSEYFTLQTGTTSYNSDLGFALNNGGLVTFIGANNTPGPVVAELKNGQPLTFVSSTSTQTPISAWCAVVRTTLLVVPFPPLLAMYRSFSPLSSVHRHSN
jgi:hypothetical protein